ncbi:MAG: hypothetical protein WAL84_12730 [Candidatus Dormiibacterota bacterium]
MSRWIGVVMRRGTSPDRLSEHAVREQRLDHIRDAVERFTYTLGLLIAGHDPEDSADESMAGQLQRELRPFLDAGDAMRPDFGAFGDLRIEGELLQVSMPVLATLEFDERCARETVHGRVIPSRGRRLRLTMHITVEPARIIDCAVSEVPDRLG